MEKKKILFITLGLLAIVVVSFIIILLLKQINDSKINLLINENKNPIAFQEVKNKITTIDIETSMGDPSIPIKKYTLNQEEMNVIFNITDNLTFSKETCQGLSTYIIRYNSEEKDGLVVYGIETYDKEYHMRGNDGEAILSDEQREQLDKIISKLNNSTYMEEIKNKVTTIDIETSMEDPSIPIKKYTLNQEEMNVIFNIMDNLTFSKETCQGLSTHIIRYNTEEKDGLVVYGIETYDKEYHIRGNDGEAILSDEQRGQLDKIINKLEN